MSSPSLSLLLAGQLRKLRRRHGLTQERAAALIGCDYKYYQAVEAGAKDLRLSMVERMARPFGLHPQQLFLQKLPLAPLMAGAHKEPPEARNGAR